MKKKTILFLTIATLLFGPTTAYAKIAISKCPIVTNASEIDKKYLTAYEIHQGMPPVSDDYMCWVFRQ